MSAGAEMILRAADRADPRPLWITVWGGANTLAQALLHARDTRTAAELDALVGKLRVYAISDQDDAGPWIRREFPALHYIADPLDARRRSVRDGDLDRDQRRPVLQERAGRRLLDLRNRLGQPEHPREGPAREAVSVPVLHSRGDTPSFLGLTGNGLDSAMSPTFGGWGGRYVWRQFYGESHPAWTQGGDAFPGRDSSRDTVTGVDGRKYTSDQATIWRWREAFQHDFAARMDWTIQDRAHANHNPIVVVNGQPGKAPITITARVGAPVDLDASASTDPDGDPLKFTWFFYPEAGTGIPSRPVVATGLAPVGGATTGRGWHPVGSGGASRTAAARHHRARGSRPGHRDAAGRRRGPRHPRRRGRRKPSLTSYRRVILQIQPDRQP